MEKIRIILAESSDVMVYGLSQIILSHENLEICGKATRYNHLCQLIEDIPHHIVLLGPLMMEKYSQQIVQYLTEKFPDINLVVLEDSDNKESILEKLEEGYSKVVNMGV